MAPEDEGASLDWRKHEDKIRHLFISQNRTWKEVAAEMSERYGFTATCALRSQPCFSKLTCSSERQYKYCFPGLKNVKEDEWVYIEEQIRSREALGKQSLAYLHEAPLPASRVSRGIARARAARPGLTRPLSDRKFMCRHTVSNPSR